MPLAQIGMPWTTGTVGIAAGLPRGIKDSEVDPAWQPWLDLLEIALEESGDEWRAALRVHAERPAGAPLLHGAMLRIDERCARALVTRLSHAAGIAGGADIDAAESIRAAIARDEESLSAMADDIGISVDAFAVIAQAAALPLLRVAATLVDVSAAAAWPRSYCPVCGARPALAEVRGIERERRLRCGSCGGDWPLATLHCAYCDELDHEKLGTLRVEGEEQLRHIETCESCRGYLKSIMTFDALSYRALVLSDLSTIPLDLAAQERGFARPAKPGWAPRVELAT